MNPKLLARILLVVTVLPVGLGVVISGCGPTSEEQENRDKMIKGLQQQQGAMKAGSAPSNIPSTAGGK
jgi:hypothetical protein